MKLLIYSPFLSPRLQYVCQQIFGKWYGWEYGITNYVEDYQQYEGLCLNYSQSRVKDKEVFIPISSLLSNNDIQPLALSSHQYIKIPAFFNKENPRLSLKEDLLAAIFLHLSRYEEYLLYQPDQHKRFTAKSSWAYQYGYLQVPIVDQWISQLFEVFRATYPSIPPINRTFTKILTYDIDMAWAYLHKGGFRYVGGFARAIWRRQWKELQQRIAVARNTISDPYDTFPLFEQWSKQYNYKTIYFFLLGKYGKYDKNIAPSNSYFQQLIQTIANDYTIGIHPSYLSNTSTDQLIKEINTLAQITRQPIMNSRQHFLKLHLPYTYQQLLKLGIKNDYSMGYAAAVGFRAGTSLPFYWYDLEQEKSTDLLIHPFQVMDVTLKEYLHLSPTAAMQTIQDLIEATKAVNGTFCSLWHNSSFSFIEEWEEWREVYEFLLKY